MKQAALPLPVPNQPVTVNATCPRCGGDRDKMLVRLMTTILRLRSRLAELDPGGEQI